MKIEVVKCDLCKEIMGRLIGGNAMVLPGDSFQSWGDCHICKSCCTVLSEARRLDLIEFDKVPLFEQAGFIKREAEDGFIGWEAPSFMKMYGGEFWG